MSKFIDIHILQSVPASCINRDDSGQPKTVTYGGALRSRVSSQAWKRATRMRFEQESESIVTDEEFLKTYGTKNLVRLIAREMQEQNDNLDEDEALDTAKECLGVALSTSKFESGKGKDPYQTKTRYVMSLGQIRNLAKYCLTHNQSDFAKDKTEIKKLVIGKNSLALSLFGRMVADDESLNVDASCQVAHAFTVNAISPQFDYFTAVDDVSDQQGSAFIQSAGYSTGVFYRYANINVSELEHNLGNEELTKLGLELFLKDFALSMPTGKENSFANNTLPSYVEFDIRDTQPVNYASAFEKPIASKAGYMDKAVEALSQTAVEDEKLIGKPLTKVIVNVKDQDSLTLDEAIDEIVEALGD